MFYQENPCVTKFTERDLTSQVALFMKFVLKIAGEREKLPTFKNLQHQEYSMDWNESIFA